MRRVLVHSNAVLSAAGMLPLLILLMGYISISKDSRVSSSLDMPIHQQGPQSDPSRFLDNIKLPTQSTQSLRTMENLRHSLANLLLRPLSNMLNDLVPKAPGFPFLATYFSVGSASCTTIFPTTLLLKISFGTSSYAASPCSSIPSSSTFTTKASPKQ